MDKAQSCKTLSSQIGEEITKQYDVTFTNVLIVIGWTLIFLFLSYYIVKKRFVVSLRCYEKSSFLILICSYTAIFGQQITVSSSYTAQQLVENILINNPCIQVSNVAVSGGNFTTGEKAMAILMLMELTAFSRRDFTYYRKVK